MPNYDGTGPDRKGPMTGRGRGFCIVPLNTKQEETKFLKTQEKVLKEQLQQVEVKLKELEVSTCGGER